MSKKETTPSTSETQNHNETLRTNIMEIYHNGVIVLEKTLEKNKKEQQKLDEKALKPRGTVVVSLYEEDKSLLTAKMFEHSLKDLINQAQQSGLELDVLIVANNGGGSTPEVGSLMSSKVLADIGNIPEFESVTKVKTSRPNVESLDASTPWEISRNIKDVKKSAAGNRVLYIEQEFNSLNKGKIRAIRDISNYLTNQILENGYTPDFIFQMDAETILKYKDKKLENSIAPLKVLYNQISRGGKIAAGTKDKFAIMDPDSGLPLDKPIGSAQKGFEATNTPDKFISLPGGALMSKPANYIAGMVAISRETPSMGVEDYMFTKLLREDATEQGQGFENVAESVGLITHLNRTPENWRQAIKQMANWRKHARAADDIFPGNPYNTESIVKYVALVIEARFKDALDGGTKHLYKLIRDVQDLPYVMEFINDENAPDIANKNEGVSWTSNKQDQVSTIA
jgi:hypothetical protein